MKQTLALFDFDGTISSKDSMIEFLKYFKGKKKFYLTFLLHAHWIILMYLGIMERWKVKEKIWVSLFENTAIKDFNKTAEKFSLEILPTIIYASAFQQIKKHKEEGDRVIIVSASAENYLKPWCDNNQLELISTQLEIKNGVVTGKIAGNNCNGKEKAIRIKNFINLKEFDQIYAYGNSSGDKEMLKIATHPFYKYFK